MTRRARRKSIRNRARLLWRKGWLISVCATALILVIVFSCSDEETTPSGPEKDTTPPEVVSIVPSDSSRGISTAVSISVTFSECMEPSSIDTNTFMVSGVSGTVNCSDSVATCTPDSPLEHDIWYAVTITTGVTDLAGNAMEKEFSSAFRTIPEGSALTADAGEDADASFDEMVNLDGSGSFDPGFLQLSYEWRQILRHPAPPVTWNGSTSIVNPEFIAPDTVSTLEFELMVTNGTDEDRDTVVVTVLRDKDHALFASKSGSDSYPDPGSRSKPFGTIQAAVEEAAGQGADVYVSGGTYQGSITLKNGVNIYGGFHDDGTGTWLHDIQSFTTSIHGGATAVKGTDVSSVILDGLCICSSEGGGSGKSSIAISLHNCSNITVSRDSIHASRGANGRSQVIDDPALDGKNGNKGNNGAISKCCCDGCNCTTGGGSPGSNTIYRGGYGGGAGAVISGDGGNGTGPRPGGGGTAGLSAMTGSNGGGGGNGGGYAIDSRAQNGSGGSNFGHLSSDDYTAADGGDGRDGLHGSGGGGGGGGGGSLIAFYANCSGGGGGGGGAGGNGGLGGPGGGGGGGSIGILLASCTDISLYRTKIVTSKGGNGGSAGRGGDGGAGGEGGNGGARIVSHSDWINTYYTGSGGKGGKGGRGQCGGHGGGGGGGPSVCLLHDAVSTFEILDDCADEYWYPASGGSGGDAGGDSTYDGLSGISGRIYPPQ